jgi:uncharacterized membrane protein
VSAGFYFPSHRRIYAVPLQSVTSGIRLVVALGALALFFGVTLYVCDWIYCDARTNSSRSAGGWLVVSILVPVLGVFLYFPVGRDRTGHHETHGSGR